MDGAYPKRCCVLCGRDTRARDSVCGKCHGAQPMPREGDNVRSFPCFTDEEERARDLDDGTARHQTDLRYHGEFERDDL